MGDFPEQHQTIHTHCLCYTLLFNFTVKGTRYSNNGLNLKQYNNIQSK